MLPGHSNPDQQRFVLVQQHLAGRGHGLQTGGIEVLTLQRTHRDEVDSCEFGQLAHLLRATLGIESQAITHYGGVPFLLQMWFFLSPVVYPSESLSPGIQSLVALNPMTGWIGLFRFCLLGGPFQIGPVITASAITLVVALGGVFYFRQVEDALADIV